MKDKLFIEKEFECEYCKKKYKAINNNTNRGYYTIKATNNDNLYFGFNESNLAIDNQIKLVSNSSSNIKQFVFVKAE